LRLGFIAISPLIFWNVIQIIRGLARTAISFQAERKSSRWYILFEIISHCLARFVNLVTDVNKNFQAFADPVFRINFLTHSTPVAAQLIIRHPARHEYPHIYGGFLFDTEDKLPSQGLFTVWRLNDL
jgi:hypothetical protein